MERQKRTQTHIQRFSTFRLTRTWFTLWSEIQKMAFLRATRSLTCPLCSAPLFCPLTPLRSAPLHMLHSLPCFAHSAHLIAHLWECLIPLGRGGPRVSESGQYWGPRLHDVTARLANRTKFVVPRLNRLKIVEVIPIFFLYWPIAR